MSGRSMKTARRKPDSALKAAAAASSPAGRGWITPALAAACAIGLVFLIYAPALNGPFLFDDEYLPFQAPGFLDMGINGIARLQRPLLNLSFFANALLFGMEPYSYHAFNIVLHLFNGALLYLILGKLIRMTKPETPRPETIAAFAALIFLVHPANTESVAYVAGRSECFSLVFFLAAFALFLHKREGGVSWLAAVGILALFAGAFLSKEHTAVLPALLLVTDLFYNQGSPAATVRRHWRLYAPLALLGVAGGALVWRVLSTADTAGFAMKDLPWHHYFFTQWRALWVYLKLFVFPAGLNADYDFPISRGPLDHGALFGLIGIVALLGAAFHYRKRFPLAFFGLLVFFLLIAPTSSVAPIKDPIAERRLYMPFAGLLLAVCDVLRQWSFPRLRQLTVMGFAVAALSAATCSRSAVWSDPQLLWEDTVRKSPGNSRAHFQLAMVYYTAGRCAQSLNEFEQAASTGKNDHTLLVDWGLALDCAGQPDAALVKFRDAAGLDNTAHVRSLIGMVLAKQNRLDMALDELNLAARIDANYDMTYVYRGNIYRMRREWDRAEADYREALRLNKQNQVAEQSLAELGKEKGGGR